MNARKVFKRLFHPRFTLAAAQLRLAALVDEFVARWLARCAANAEAAQRLFTSDRKPARGFPDRRGPRRFLAALE
jgi:hypothetical protein